MYDIRVIVVSLTSRVSAAKTIDYLLPRVAEQTLKIKHTYPLLSELIPSSSSPIRPRRLNSVIVLRNCKLKAYLKWIVLKRMEAEDIPGIIIIQCHWFNKWFACPLAHILRYRGNIN